MVVRIAFGQAACAPGDVAANTATAVRLLDRAAALDARILLLPELFLCGYDLDGLAHSPERYAVGAGSPHLADLADACRRAGTGLIVGAALRTAVGALTNAALVIDRDGRPRGAYEKAHLWEAERKLFTAGDALLSVRIGDVTMGIGICYDAAFPEFGRAYAGHDALLFAGAFATGDEERRYDLYHPMRALENTSYVVTANALGGPFFGRSGAHDPYGRLVATAGTAAGVGVVDIDPDVVRAARTALPYLRDRRGSFARPRLERLP